MSLLSLFHALSGLLTLLVGIVLLCRRKGDRTHRVLGRAYAITMFASLVGILVQTRTDPAPFAAYAVFMLAVLTAAIAAARLRKRIPAWRAWHGALMSLTVLASGFAAASIIGGLLLDMSAGPPFYRLFNVIVLVATVAGLGLIATRKVLWGHSPGPAESAARRRFLVLASTASLLLVAAQWRLAWPE